jgi:general nucleoside transport system permease protein
MHAMMLAAFLGSSVRLAMPLMLAAVGELVSERAGVLNMSLEGMMLTGAFVAATASWATGSPAIGLAAAVLGVLPMALLQAWLTVGLRANQIVSGLGLNILALGATTLAYREIFGARARDVIPGFSRWSIPGLSQIPVFGDALFTQVWLVYAAPALFVATAFVLTRTGIGIAVHAAGEDPDVVAKAGLSVKTLRTGVILFTGVMAALGGAFLSISDIHTFTEGMTNGAGYLAIAAVIFGRWRIGGAILACLLFGAATALQFQLPDMGVNVPSALLIMSPYLLAFLSVAGLVGGQKTPRALSVPYW